MHWTFLHFTERAPVEQPENTVSDALPGVMQALIGVLGFTGTAAWFRAIKSDGTAVLDGSVGTSGANLNLNSVGFVSGAPVSVSSWTLSEPAAGA